MLSAAFSSVVGLYLLLSVIPLYTEEAGGGSFGAGLSTATFMAATVLAQVQMPRALRRFGYRTVLGAGLLLLGVPAFLYPAAGGVGSILAVTLVRGLGFGVAIVAVAALATELAPPGRRGEMLGLLGLALSLPVVFGGASGIWLSEHAGYSFAFVIGGVVPILGFAATLGIGGTLVSPQDGGAAPAGFLTGLRRPELWRLLLIFAPTTVAFGAVATFLPLSAPGTGVFSAATALFLLGATTTLFRLWAGRFGDRHDAHRLLAPGLLSAALGMVLVSGGGVAMIAGSLLFGVGFGVVQSATLVLTMERVSKAEYGLGSTLWNVAFDGGVGAGAFAGGLLVWAVGFSGAFIFCSGLLAAAMLLVYQDRVARAGAGHKA